MNYRQISFVIPTWNEALWLDRLLNSISHAQARTAVNIADVIVADAGSSDSTAEVALSYGCKVVVGGSPAEGRNRGARAAAGDLLFFADADVLVTPDILASTLRIIGGHPKPDAVSFLLDPLTLPTERVFRLYYAALNAYFRVAYRLRKPQGMGSLLVVDAVAFRELGGFDEGLTASEDMAFLEQAKRMGRTVVLNREATVPVSSRRLRVERPLYLVAKGVLRSLLRLCHLPHNFIPYPWFEYSQALFAAEIQLAASHVEPFGPIDRAASISSSDSQTRVLQRDPVAAALLGLQRDSCVGGVGT